MTSLFGVLKHCPLQGAKSYRVLYGYLPVYRFDTAYNRQKESPGAALPGSLVYLLTAAS